MQARALIIQLDENHDRLNKMYKQAKKGKKQRALVNAGLGATTGIGPVVIKDQDQSKVCFGYRWHNSAYDGYTRGYRSDW